MKQKLNICLMVIMCCALAVSLYFNFKNPYLPTAKAEHLGSMTYTLPDGCKWKYVNSDTENDGIYGVEGNTGKVLAKGYVEMEGYSILTIEYGINEDDEGFLDLSTSKGKSENISQTNKNGKTIVLWSGDYEAIPKCVTNIRIATDAYEDADGTIYGGSYWKALFEVNGKEYLVKVYDEAQLRGDVQYIGESVISSIGYDKSLNDEYEKNK